MVRRAAHRCGEHIGEDARLGAVQQPVVKRQVELHGSARHDVVFHNTWTPGHRTDHDDETYPREWENGCMNALEAERTDRADERRAKWEGLDRDERHARAQTTGQKAHYPEGGPEQKPS